MKSNKDTKETLLQQVIEKYSTNYKPPIGRSGIKRGDEIAFSQKKYDASLYTALTNKPLKEIANELEIKYGVLKLWKIEKRFKELMQQHQRHFALHTVGELQKKIGFLHDYEDTILEKNIEEIMSAPIPPIAFDEFRDANTYNPALVEEIYTHLFKRSFGGENEFFNFLILKFVKNVLSVSLNPKLWIQTKKSAIFLIKHLLKDGQIKTAMYYLRQLEEMEGTEV